METEDEGKMMKECRTREGLGEGAFGETALCATTNT
jgi:hypothetical protein